MKQIRINENRSIGDNEPCFIVAEIGLNHNGDVGLAKKMIDAAIECGVDGVKFQTFKADEFVSDPNETYTYRSQGKEITESILEMFRRYEFSENEWVELFDYCKQKGIVYFSTPQNSSDLDLLLKIIDLPIIKVGSDDLTNLELLKYYASKNIPMIISAGMAFMSEIEDAVNAIKETGNNDLAVLHCVSSYPAELEEINLRKMITIRQEFDVIVGFSDHTIGATASMVSAALGAKIIEKHFTLDKGLPGSDHWFSATSEELTSLIRSIRSVEKAMGSYIVKPTSREEEMRKIARRSIVASKDMEKGDLITDDALSVKRPGTGLAPKFRKDVLGKRAKVDISKGELVTFEKIYEEEKIDNVREFWKTLWNERAESDDIFEQAGRSSCTPLDFFVLIHGISKTLELGKEDVVLDAGGGTGSISMCISPFVKEVTLFDYAEKLVNKAKESTAHFNNIRVMHDDLISMDKVGDKKYTKVIVGSVIQYLEGIEQVETSMRHIYDVMLPGSIAVFIQNPDIRKQEAHINSYSRLGWDEERIQKSLEWEKKRLWFDIDEIRKIAKRAGFAECEEVPINPKLWESTYMFDFKVKK